MSDLNSMLPVGKMVKIGSREFLIKPFSILEFSEFQAWIKRTYPHPLDAVRTRLEGFSPEERASLIAHAEEEAKNWPPQLGTVEADMHLRGLEGLHQIARMLIKKADKSLSDDDVTEYLGSISAGEFFKSMEAVLSIAFGGDDDPKDDAEAQAAS